MHLDFPYQYELLDGRQIPYPLVLISLETIRGRRDFSFIMDTGADTLTLPRYMISLLGLKESNLKMSKSQGIGKELVKVWETDLEFQMGEFKIKSLCCFTDHDQTPFLLGKSGIFDKFNVIFDNKKNMTVFEEI